MQPSAGNIIPAIFFEQLRNADASVLMLDYDGTLAPFNTERQLAYPYPQVVPILKRIINTNRSRVVLVTGRAIVDLQPLLHPLAPLEIWGSHGIEHLSADGTYSRINIPEEAAAALIEAESRLASAGLADRSEVKPGGVAIHWRGLSTQDTYEVYTSTHNCLKPFMQRPELKLLDFDGGVELRVAHPNKGDAVNAIKETCSAITPMAYLGDDHTDEAAFLALNPGGTTVLVRDEYRRTNAQFWLRPPLELIKFLQTWCDCVAT